MNKCMKWLAAGLLAMMVTVAQAGVSVTNVVAQQRYPWNGLVDVDYEVVCDNPETDIWVYPVGMDEDMRVSMAMRSLSGAGVGAPVRAGTHRMTWDAQADYPEFKTSAFTVKMYAITGAAQYMVVDLSGGVDALSYPVSYLNAEPVGGWTDEYKGDKLVLRIIAPGTFMMGSPTDELGRQSNETLHQVTLTQPYYVGVFEVTQRQWFLVMGANPSYQAGDYRPVHNVSYNVIRGTVNGAQWPVSSQVDANSFMGRLQSKTNMRFDLPTDAQWEYACRAGTGTALNSGKNLTATGTCPNMAEVGRYCYNQSDGKGGYTYCTKVGSYLPNAWGLYDMHGNVWEWCLDFHVANLGATAVSDPKGASSGSRVRRGGDCYNYLVGAYQCRSARRDYADVGATYVTSGNPYDLGLRVACMPAL